MEPRFERYTGTAPVDFVINQNNNRRHQTVTERSVAAAKLANLTHGGDRKGDEIKAPVGALKNEPIPAPLMSREEAAAKLGVSKSSVDRTKYSMDHGKPEVVEALEKGQITVNKAYEQS